MSVTLTFHGAAGCVTGSCALLEAGGARLLVDCGMFQGSKTLKELNYGRLPFEPRSVDAVLLTHAHIDHSGLLPKLARAGFSGPVFATGATRDLCKVMLADAGHIQETEVEQLNRRNRRRGRHGVSPIYTARDAAEVMGQFREVRLGKPADVAPGVEATWWEAGHLLGSGSIAVRIAGEQAMTLLFSGDIGPGGSDYLPDPEGPSGIDHLIIESTYGDRERRPVDGEARRALLAEELRAAHAAGGPLVVPAFAVERSQELLADILTLMRAGAAPRAEIFLDSPLAIEATEIFQRRGWNRTAATNPFEGLRDGAEVHFLKEPWESDDLERVNGWHVIMAASGMCDAGRIRKHLKRLLWREEATVLLAGYQAGGTLGRILQDGAKRVTIQGEQIEVRARIRSLDVYSGHADAAALEAWHRARRPIAGDTFILHGEETGRSGLKARLAASGFPAERIRLPRMDETFVLSPAAAASEGAVAQRISPAAAGGLDWHNMRAQLLLDLDQRLQDCADDGARERLLAEVAAAVAAARGSSAAAA